MSLFGASTTQPQTSLFGNPAGGQQQPQPVQTPSLFGSSAPGQQGQQQQPQGTNLFGSTLGQPPQQQQTQQPAGGLFGGGFGQNQQANQQQSAAPNNFFGQGPAQQQQQQQTAPGTTNSLFGGSTTQPQQPGGQFGGFGSNALNTTTTGNGLFGQSTAGFGGFGANQSTIQRQPTLSAFGAGTTNTNSLFKQPSQQINLSATTQSTGSPVFVKSTKFNDLPDDVKRTLESIDSHIQGRIQISNELKHRKLGEEATKSQDLIRSVHKDLVNVISDLQSDVHHTRGLKAKTEQTVQDTIVATRIIDGFRNPQQHGVYLKNHANFPLEFFQRVTEELRDRLRWYKSTIEQIERKLASAAMHSQATPHAIVTTLEAQHATFMALASKTAAVDAELQKIKALYTQLWRGKTGSLRDPFNNLDRGAGDFGLESLSGK